MFLFPRREGKDGKKGARQQPAASIPVIGGPLPIPSKNKSTSVPPVPPRPPNPTLHKTPWKPDGDKSNIKDSTTAPKPAQRNLGLTKKISTSNIATTEMAQEPGATSRPVFSMRSQDSNGGETLTSPKRWTIEPYPTTGAYTGPETEPGSLFQPFPALKYIPKLSLPALAPVQVNERTLTLYRTVAGDYGFSLRRAQFPDGRGNLRVVVFVEPTQVRNGPPRPSEMKTGLLPGDQLVEVNGRAVNSFGRDELLTELQTSGDTIELTVRAMPELAELCDRRARGVRDTGDSLMLPPIQNTYLDQGIKEEERYWLMHKQGYTMAGMIETLNDGKVKISVAGTEMLVDTTDVDRANPTTMDRVEDVARLRYINETSAVHVLRHRYGSGLLFTNAACQNSICMSGERGSFMSAKLVALFKGCRRQQMPPHIYACAQHAYRMLQMTRRNQCMVLTGVSGSGKSTQLRSLCHYLCEIAGWQKDLSYETISSALGVLEALGNCTTSLNKNASRFAQMFTLNFNAAASLKSAQVTTFLLDNAHVVKHAPNETNFHVFTYLLQGSDEALVDKLKLDAIVTPFRTPLEQDEDKQAAKMGWRRLQEAFHKLGITEPERHAIFSVLAAIGHLCCAQATQSSARRAQFVRATSAQNAAMLLGVSMEQLACAVFRTKQLTANTTQTPGTIDRQWMSNRGVNGQEALDRFVMKLYDELFDAVVVLVNRGLSTTQTGSTNSITVIDYPGANFNSPWIEDKHKVCNLTDLTYNYLNERVAELFYKASFTDAVDLYAREQVDVEVDVPATCPEQITRLIDQKQQLLNCVDIELRSEERRGVLCILDEEASFPGATDDSFCERIFVHLGQSNVIRRGYRMREFELAHSYGNSPMTYNVDGWVKAAQPESPEGSIIPLLGVTSDASIGELFRPYGAAHATMNSLALNKARHTMKLDAAGLRSANGFFDKISRDTDFMMTFASRSGGLHFVHCIQPQTTQLDTQTVPGNELALDVSFVRSQLRSLLVVDAARASSVGYPERLPFRDFRRRFQCLVKRTESIVDELDDRTVTGRILTETNKFPHTYRLGLSQVLIRSDVLADLETKRELCLSGIIEELQRHCRRHLASMRLERRRAMETAIRCIQKNGRCYINVRGWNWWKLYTKVTPLLASARSDDEMREWKERNRDMQSQNAQLRLERNQYESRVAELEQMLSVQACQTESLTEALARETEHRLQTQKRFIAIQQRHPEEMQLSTSSSTHSRLDLLSLNSDAKTIELHKEMDTLRANEQTQRTRAQKATEKQREVEVELQDIRARNQELETRNAGFDDEMKVVKEECSKLNEVYEQQRQEHIMATTSLEQRTKELKEIKSENVDLQADVSKLRNELESVSENGDGSPHGDKLTQKRFRQLEEKCVEQEEELNELAGHEQQLQQTVTRLEMAADRAKSDKTRDLQAKDEEIADLRASFQRRTRVFEAQIEDLHEANSALTKQNNILDGRIRVMDPTSYSSVGDSSGRYKRDLRKTLALLHDTQTMLQRERDNQPNQTMLIRQLRQELNDADALKLSVLKSKQSLEKELNDTKAQVETAMNAKKASESRVLSLLKEKSSAVQRADELEDQLQILLDKYKEVTQQMTLTNIELKNAKEQLAEADDQRHKLSQQVNEVTSQLDHIEGISVKKHKLQLAEQKVRELEAKLGLEQTVKSRLDTLLAKATDEIDLLNEHVKEAKRVHERDEEVAKRVGKDTDCMQNQLVDMRKREQELKNKYERVMSEMSRLELDKTRMDKDLKGAEARIATLHAELQVTDDELDSENSDWQEDILDQLHDDGAIDGSIPHSRTSQASLTNGSGLKTNGLEPEVC